MKIRYGYDIRISVGQPTPVVCALDVHPDRRGDIINEYPFSLRPHGTNVTKYIDGFGNICRRFVAQPGVTALRGDGVLTDSGLPDITNAEAGEVPIASLPDDVLVYLLGSRYCETDRLANEAWNLFGGIAPGWGRVQAIVAFVNNHIRFDYQQARSTRTALDGYQERVGVCRDFSHLAITFCRCMNIPARYVNGYLGDIGVPYDPNPMDFSAWFEVYLDGGWYTFDARHNKKRIGRIVIARGRDATDVPLINSFGPHILTQFLIWTDEVSEDIAPLMPVAAKGGLAA